MRNITQKQLDKMPVISREVLAATQHSLRNYIVYLGESFATMFEIVHVGLGSMNHLETIKGFVNGQPIYKVLLDNRKMA